MSDQPQGPGWWQASDHKWYPPEKHATYAAPPSPPGTPTQPPTATKGRAERSKVWFTVAGIALILVTAALVAGRVLLGTFLPGLLLVAAIAIIGGTLVIRSSQTVTRKATTVTAVVLVVAAAIPASLKVVYPVYHHFFNDGTSQASRSAGSPASASNGDGTASPRISSGIVIVNNVNTTGKRTYGIIDPNSGTYSDVATFNPDQITGHGNGTIMPPQTLAASPDLTKLAVTTSGRGKSDIGWIDTSGNFTGITAEPTASSSEGMISIGFDGAGNFYYWTGKVLSHDAEIFEVPAGSTTNSRKIKSEAGSEDYHGAWIDYDGSMHFGCDPQTQPNAVVTWFGPDSMLKRYSSGINKAEVTGRDQKGCLKLGQEIPLWSSGFDISGAVASHDGTKVAFRGRKVISTTVNPGSYPSVTYSDAGIYIAAADGSGQPTKLNVSNLTSQQLAAMILLKWM
jgi:Tfp pilus assembly major pilin PilA